jgi:hypothetical protein
MCNRPFDVFASEVNPLPTPRYNRKSLDTLVDIGVLAEKEVIQ